MKSDLIRIVRILEYVGPREQLERMLSNTGVPLNGQCTHQQCCIRSATLGSFPEILERATAGADVGEADPNHEG